MKEPEAYELLCERKLHLLKNSNQVNSQYEVAGPSGAAAKLGIPRSTLDLRIKQLDIKKTPPGNSHQCREPNFSQQSKVLLIAVVFGPSGTKCL